MKNSTYFIIIFLIHACLPTVVAQNLNAVTFQTLPVTCRGNDGEVIFSNHHFDYIWSDGGIGSIRTDLKEGTYQVWASDSSQSRIFDIKIENACDCNNFIKPTQIITQATSCHTLTPVYINLGENKVVNIFDNGFSYTNNVQNTEGGITLQLEAYDHLLFMVHQFGCVDTLVISVACTTMDTLDFELELGQSLNTCFSSNELWGENYTCKELHEPQHKIVAFSNLTSKGCFEMTATKVGFSVNWWIVTDEYGITDTFLVRTQVLPTIKSSNYNPNLYAYNRKSSLNTLEIDINIKPNLTIYNAFSPNGDAVNDNFEIQGIEQYPQNHLIIYDATGRKILNVSNYKNDWSGTLAQNPLPTGTYFYALNDGEGKSYTGYLQLER